jgi:hypothetical protein
MYALGIAAPLTTVRTPLQKNVRSYAWPIIGAEVLDIDHPAGQFGCVILMGESHIFFL